MPNFDGKGPQGQGSMTGRRRGRCKDTENADRQNQFSENEETTYGLGRGGRPHGGGGFGQRQNGQQGKGTRRGFGRNRS